MNRVIKYQCDYCARLFDDESICESHENRHAAIIKANEMLQNNHTLQEIQDQCNIWDFVPDHLKDVTTKNCFVVSHWQCCHKPAYRIVDIDMKGRIELSGYGSYFGHWSNYVNLSYDYLSDPRPEHELFIHEDWLWTQEPTGDDV